jgi:hypothetical protein
VLTYVCKRERKRERKKEIKKERKKEKNARKSVPESIFLSLHLLSLGWFVLLYILNLNYEEINPRKYIKRKN